MKDLKKRIESNISTPIIWYAIILATAVVFLVISSIITHFTSDSNWWGLLLLNFGYGTFASLVVSVLIDIGNTKRQRIMLDSKHDLLIEKCVRTCYSLRDCVRDCMDEIYSIDKPMTYEEYVENAFSPDYDTSFMDEEQYREELERVITVIGSLEEAARELVKLIPYVYDEKTNKEFLSEINKIDYCCRCIKNDYNYNRYDRLVSRMKAMKNVITKAFPKLNDVFTTPYKYDEEEFDD